MTYRRLASSTLSMCYLLLHLGWLNAQLPDGGRQVQSELAYRLLRELPDTQPPRRTEIVTKLYSMATNRTPNSSLALYEFGSKVTTNDDGTTTMNLPPDRNRVLSRVLPVLIDMIDDTERVTSKPWWILISLQGSCPEPKKATWQRWWMETGSKIYKDRD